MEDEAKHSLTQFYSPSSNLVPRVFSAFIDPGNEAVLVSGFYRDTLKYTIYEVLIVIQKMADEDVEELQESLSQFVSLACRYLTEQ